MLRSNTKLHISDNVSTDLCLLSMPKTKAMLAIESSPTKALFYITLRCI